MKHTESSGKAVILLSGGLDSFVTAGIASSLGHTLTALTFSYGQRHSVELESARAAASALGINDHRFINIDTGIFRSSLMKDSEESVPENRHETKTEIPSTYVPARNIIFLSYALAVAESTDANEIFIGANAVDYSGYPDCRPEFFDAFNRISELGTKTGDAGRPVKISTPIISLKKFEIIITGISLGLDLSVTHSCYDPADGLACGRCDSCLIRIKGFEEAGHPDPAQYHRRT